MWTTYAGVNLRDQVRRAGADADDGGVPLQFCYLPADCRLYYTLANAYNMTRQWRDAASAMFTGGDAGLCVARSEGDYIAQALSTGPIRPPARPRSGGPETSLVESGPNTPG